VEISVCVQDSFACDLERERERERERESMKKREREFKVEVNAFSCSLLFPVVDHVVLLSISSTLYAHIFCTNFLTKPERNQKKLPKQRSYEKFVHKTLMKLTPVVNFTNILLAAFLCKIVLHNFSLHTVWLCKFLMEDYRSKSCS